VGGAHDAGIKGQGVVMAIFEDSLYQKDVMNTFFPDRWSLGSGEYTPSVDPSKYSTSNKTHSVQVASFADSVAPSAHFVLYAPNGGPYLATSALNHIAKSKEATVINWSEGIKQDSSTKSCTSNSTMLYTDCDVFGSDSVIMFLAAGNYGGHASCNRVYDAIKRTLCPLSDYDAQRKRNIFFVSNAINPKNNVYELTHCYPENGEKDTHFFVSNDVGPDPYDGADISGTSFSAPKCAAIAALLQCRWPYFKVHCNQLGILLWETADVIRVKYTKKYDSDGNPLKTEETKTEGLRRPNVAKALNFSESTAKIAELSWKTTTSQASAAFGNSFHTLGLCRVVSVDHYGRSWSGLTDKAADVSRQISVQQEPSLTSALMWCSALPFEENSFRAFSPHVYVHAFGRKRASRRDFVENNMSAQMHIGEMHFSLISHVHTTVAVHQRPGMATFASPGILLTHVSWSQQNGLLSMLPPGMVVRNDITLGTAYTLGTEFFYVKETQSAHFRNLYKQNDVHGGLVSFSGTWNSLHYRLRMGAFRESTGVLMTKSAGALSFGDGSVTSSCDLTTLWKVTDNFSIVNTLVCGYTQVRSLPKLLLITPTAPMRTMEWRMGIMSKETLGTEHPINWGLFYCEPKRVVSAPVRLRLPVEHRIDGSIRYQEERTHLRPDAKERRIEGIIETPLPWGLRFSTAVSYIKNPGHSRNTPSHLEAAIMVSSK
jgi:hypothetical protein